MSDAPSPANTPTVPVPGDIASPRSSTSQPSGGERAQLSDEDLARYSGSVKRVMVPTSPPHPEPFVPDGPTEPPGDRPPETWHNPKGKPSQHWPQQATPLESRQGVLTNDEVFDFDVIGPDPRSEGVAVPEPKWTPPETGYRPRDQADYDSATKPETAPEEATP